MVALLSVAEARQQLLDALDPVGNIHVPIGDAFGYVLAQLVHATFDAPSFSNSSMDGFAVRSMDTRTTSAAQSLKLAVVGDIPAGVFVDHVLRAGETMRIMTGAALPQGSDAVIPVEDTNIEHHLIDLPDHVELQRKVEPGDYVRNRGEDFVAGQVLLEPGRRLRPQDVALLAMLGLTKIEVHRRPTVAILSSGDELVPVGGKLQRGQIHNSNSYSLAAQVQSCLAGVIDLGIARDSEAVVKQSLDEAVRQNVDLIITSAGVSVGAYDYVRLVVEKYGDLSIWRVNMRPGKPFTFGLYGETPFIGLPGNPVSAFVGFEVFARPALQKLAGVKLWERARQFATLSEDITSDGRESFLRARITHQEGGLTASLAEHQGSGNLYSLVQANGLIILPARVKSLKKGSQVEAWLFE